MAKYVPEDDYDDFRRNTFGYGGRGHSRRQQAERMREEALRDAHRRAEAYQGAGVNNTWNLNHDYKKWTKKKYNDNKYWKKSYPSDSVSMFYSPKGDNIILTDHYNENVSVPIIVLSDALMEREQEELDKINMMDGDIKFNYIAQIVITYCARNALICYPMEEVLI